MHMRNIMDLQYQTMKTPWVLTFVGPVMTLVSLFLPYASAKDADQGAALSQLLGDDAAHPSMVGFARIYLAHAGNEVPTAQAYLTVGLTGAIAAIAMVALLFAAFRKAIPVAVLSVLLCMAHRLQEYDFSDRGIVPSDTYAWGIGHHLLFAAVLVTMSGGIWFALDKRRVRKELAEAEQHGETVQRRGA